MIFSLVPRHHQCNKLCPGEQVDYYRHQKLTEIHNNDQSNCGRQEQERYV